MSEKIPVPADVWQAVRNYLGQACPHDQVNHLIAGLEQAKIDAGHVPDKPAGKGRHLETVPTGGGVPHRKNATKGGNGKTKRS